MKPELFTLVSKNLEVHEGRVLSQYVDSVGVNTIGVGRALFNHMAATSIQFWRATDLLATADEIIADYYFVKCEKKRGKLFISYDESQYLLQQDLIRFERVVNSTFPDVDSYPPSVQVALYDIAYNTGSFVNWPRFSAAIKNRDFKTAASESKRPQVGALRNQDTFNQLNITG